MTTGAAQASVIEPMPPDAGLAAAQAHCDGMVRARDYDRWAAGLFAPATKRPHLAALYAFNLEIARVRDVVSDPLPGEMRLQWWRDALEGETRGDVRAHPVAAALFETIRAFGLPRQAFVDIVDARVFDLYDDPMPTLGDLEAYCGHTASALIRLASLILADGAEPGCAAAAGHAGVAYALAGLLRAFGWHAARGQVYVPRDILDRHGVTRDDIVQGRTPPGLAGALADMRARARRALAETRALAHTILPVVGAAFLPVALVEGWLRRMERPGYDPYRSVVERSRLATLWTLWRQARRISR